MLYYKVNVLETLKNAGYNTNYISKNTKIGNASVQNMRENKMIGMKTLDIICGLLKCDPGELIGWKEDMEEKQA